MAKIDNIVSHIPDWIAMATDTNSNGYKFMDGFGVELDEVNDILDELEKNLYIASADVNTPDYIHKMHLEQLDDYLPTELVVSSNIEVVDSVYKLLTSTTMVGMFDYDAHTFYINNYDKSTHVNVEVYAARLDSSLKPMLDSDGNIMKGSLLTTCSEPPILHHIWNCFDEFALLLGLNRLGGETNAELRTRITSVLVNPPGSNSGGLKSAISRDLGLSANDVVLKTFDDIEAYDSEDNISKEFLKYINLLKKVKPLDIARWDYEIIDDKIYSVQYVPRIFNNILDKIPEKYLQSGIGDGDDLKVIAPQKESPDQDYNCYIGLTADKVLNSTYYPRHEFKYLIDAKGIKMNKIHKPKDINFSILAAENTTVDFTIEAQQPFTTTLQSAFDASMASITSLPYTSKPSANVPSKSSTVQVVPSNTIFNQKAQYLRVKLNLKSNETMTAAPTVKQMTVKYKTATETKSINVPLNDPQDNVKNDTTDGSGNTILTIQKGEYYKVFATKKEFQTQGAAETVVFGDTAGIYLPKLQ